MEKIKIKHDHTLTKLLKVLVFSIFLLAPFMAVATKVAYTTFNKNAHLSYYGETINETQYNNLTNENQININNTYKFYAESNQEFAQTGNITIQIDNFINYSNFELSETPKKIYIYVANNFVNIQFRTEDNTPIDQKSNQNQTINFDFNYISSSGTTTLTETIQYLKIKTTNKFSYLDNSFYYAIDQVSKSNIFNWTQNTEIYNVVNTTTSQLGITEPFIPVTITYMFFITIIYILFDIIIELFTYITHLITGNK